MAHQVYIQFDEDVWVGVNWMAQRRALTREDQYTTLAVVGPFKEVCLEAPDGRRLCDFGPSHDHLPMPVPVADDG